MTTPKTRSICFSCNGFYSPNPNNPFMVKLNVCAGCATIYERGAANREYNRGTIYYPPHPVRRVLSELFRQLRGRFGR